MFKLTKAEKMVVARKRLKQSQRQRSEILGVPFGRYRQWESGVENLLEDFKCPDTSIKESDLYEYEICMLKRRRAGLTQSKIARLLGVTAVWVRKMEAGDGNVKRLKEYWNEAESN